MDTRISFGSNFHGRVRRSHTGAVVASVGLLLLAVSIGSASADDITSIVPDTIGADTTPVMRFTGAVPSPTTMVAFAQPGSCNSARVGETALGSTDTAPLGEAISVPGVYKVCYTVNAGSTWIEQSLTTLTVVRATPVSISSISPSTIGADTTPVITFDGVVPTPTTAIAFAQPGHCDSVRVGTTGLDSSDTGPLGEAIASPGTYVTCYTVDGGTSWVEQTTPRLTVVVATATTITLITPSIVGLGTTPVITFDGATPTPTTYVAFAADGQCGSPAQLGVTLLATSNAAALGAPIASPGVYRLCYTTNDGATWVQQTTPTLTVIVATPPTITLISPTIIGVDSRPVLTFTGATATPTTFVAFAPAGQCGSSAGRVGTTALDIGDTAPLGEAIASPGLYSLCFTVDGTSWVEQTTPKLTVIVVTSTSITLISPTIIAARKTPVMTFTGAIPTSTSMISFAQAGQCGNPGSRVGTTVLDDSDTEPLGEAIASPGTYYLCYSVNAGATWTEQAAPRLQVTRGDPFVGYQIKAPKKDASGAPLAGNAFPKGWAISIDDVVLSALDPGATDNPENFLVKKEKSLLLPAQQSDGAAVDLGGLHYLRYQASSAKESIQPPVGGQLAKPARHNPRNWVLECQVGDIEVLTSKVTAVLVPANKDPNAPPTAPADATHFLCYQVSVVKGRFTAQTPGSCDAAAAVNPLGSCVDDADCGGTAGQHTLCLGPAFRKDLQAFFRDQLDDCATDVSGAPSFTGTPVQGACLHDLNSAMELCNPIDMTAVEPPRETTAVITASTATTSTSLLCYKSGLAKTFENAATAAAASGPLGPVSVGDPVDPKQSQHVARATKTGTPLYTAPGNLFPAPGVVDSVKRERVCIPADVVAVTPAP